MVNSLLTRFFKLLEISKLFPPLFNVIISSFVEIFSFEHKLFIALIYLWNLNQDVIPQKFER
jgi:hypothetical protein